jgi:hypothetical protein
MNAASARTATRQRAPGSNKYWPAGGDEMGIDSQGRGVALVVTRKGAFAALSVAGFALEKERAFAQAFRYLRNRITAFIALPIRSLDELSLTTRLKEIGRMEGASTGGKVRA